MSFGHAVRVTCSRRMVTKAGMLVGDIVYTINGTPPESHSHAIFLIDGAGGKLTLMASGHTSEVPVLHTAAQKDSWPLLAQAARP